MFIYTYEHFSIVLDVDRHCYRYVNIKYFKPSAFYTLSQEIEN